MPTRSLAAENLTIHRLEMTPPQSSVDSGCSSDIPMGCQSILGKRETQGRPMMSIGYSWGGTNQSLELRV